MSGSSGLAPPGSSTYNSDTLHVGDGTWDAGRDTFLLPPLVGVNFATMRYNGMGNRFFTLEGYHSIVKAHGILAAITFLLCVPAAIFVMRFGGRKPMLARRIHIWLQILTILLSTVVLVLGVFAVGPSRALTNPHHGIGVAIYTLIWVQAIGGCLVHRRQKKHRSIHIPLRAMLHHWLGRAIALLGIAQIALGLTLYGSPLYLFVLYALVVLAMIVLYFILEWLHEKRRARYESPQSSYLGEIAGPQPTKQHGGLGRLAAAGAAGAGLATLFRRRSSGPQGGNLGGPRRHESEIDGTETGTTYSYDEKESQAPRTGWRHRLFQAGAIGGGLAAAKGLFGQRRHASDEDSDIGPSRPPLGGNQSVTSGTLSAVGGTRPPPSRPVVPVGGASPEYIRSSHPLAQPPMTPHSAERRSDDSLSYTYDSYLSASPSRHGRRHPTFREALATGGAVMAVKELWKNRRQRKEDRRAETIRRQNIEQERIQRMNSTGRYTGDGVAPPRRHHRTNSQTASDVSSILDGTVPQPASGSLARLAQAEAGLAATNALAGRDNMRPPGTDPVIITPGPASAAQTQYPQAPPLPPPHSVEYHSSGSELFTTVSGRQRHRHHAQPSLSAPLAAGIAGTGLAAAAATSAESSRRRHEGQPTDSLESPPVSLKVKMHNDGRHVTLRRLTEEEAAAQREARRRERRASAARRRRNSSFGSGSPSEILGQNLTPDERWRRTEALEARQSAENAAAAASSAQISVLPTSTPAGSQHPTPPLLGNHQTVDPQTGLPYTPPPLPPIPIDSSNLGAESSATTNQGTEIGDPSEYAKKRKRRRAERAQAHLAREGKTGGGNTVEFT